MNKRKRILAAIMFTDIVGYTAMMHDDEVAAAAVRQRHRDIFQKEHQNCHGEILQYYGDGTLSIFKSAVEAVECAIAMQQQFQTGVIVPLRIGIHLGDIVLDDNDVYGDGVNLASRVESLGIPGCVLISDKVNYAIKSQATIETTSLGHFEFKNIKDPVEVFSIKNKGIKIPDRSELKGKLKEVKKSIAVLPFVNMSSDPENEYFSDGIAEEILNALVKVEGLQVTARTSSFSFKGKNMDVREIGRLLGVRHILEGSVRKSGNRVRITAQLVSAVDGYHFFSETYDRTLEDIFAVQDEIASTITNRLREHLGEKEYQDKLVTPPTSNMEAYETYLKGLFYFNQFGDDQAMGKAVPYFEKAIAMQPDFGLPYAQLGICYYFQAMGGQADLAEARNKVNEQIQQIKRLGVDSSEAYFALGVFEIFVNWDWEAALKVVTKGLELYPNSAKLYHILATLFWINGDVAARHKAHLKALELDPLSLQFILYLGISYIWSQEFDKALPYIEKALSMAPTHRAALEYKGWIKAFTKQYEEAISIFEKLEPIGYRLHRSTCLGWVYFQINEKEKLAACLQELQDLEKQSVNFTMDLATLYASMGDVDQTFYFLEKAIKNRVGDIMMIRSIPFLNPLKSDPRFQEMEAMVGEVPAIDFPWG